MGDLVTLTDSGLYCEAGDFFVDPWRPVNRALITHAHGDHARSGSGGYLTVEDGRYLLQTRLDEFSKIESVPYGNSVKVGETDVSFHPAGHVLGSSQIRIEHKGEVWVVSGDYKVEPDATCKPIEPVECHTFITESTFGLPIYRWQNREQIFSEVNAWWQSNKAAGRASVLFCYALGKAQRILAGVDPSIGPIYTHGAVERLNMAYRSSGVNLPSTTYVGELPKGTKFGDSLIVAPPSANGTPWLRQFGPLSTGFASGWMRIRGARRRRAVDRGFVLSDHADWPGLLSTIRATKAQRVIVTHGNVNVMVRWLSETGIDAGAFKTQYEGELEDDSSGRGKENLAGIEQAIDLISEPSDLSENGFSSGVKTEGGDESPP